ncbi:KxYKxGKxW signal peptide domain-containing protein [Limosilactobacillus caecicola]|uniref:KxYKxGKxW signal peptide domain-containing protein n=1 Tax=Limosilactobacillus caecicola TaxID=2941332 RepID=UPI00203C3CFA|nr:KxYKxGKxW signal peptide domain-containing protein [Limosilactobacillus caecicola]
MKKRYKLYKRGRQWCVAALTFGTLLVAGSFLPSQAHAATNEPAATLTSTTQTTTPTTTNQVTNEVPVDSTTDNQTQTNAGHLDQATVTTNQDGQATLQASGWHATGQSNQERYRYAILYDNTTNREVARHLGNALNMTGWSLDSLKNQLINRHLVVVWQGHMHGFGTHAITLTGFDGSGFFYNDPWTAEKNAHVDFGTFDYRWRTAPAIRGALSYS